MDVHDSVIVGVICWLLAAVFAQACRHKLVQWRRFCASFAAYNILPATWVPIFAVLLIVLESVTVVALVLLQIQALWLAAGLFTVYGAGIGLNVMRGRTFIDCGCGDAPTPVSWWLVVRNMTLVVLCVVAFVLSNTTVQMSMPDAAVAFALFVVAFALYLCVEQLLANRGRRQHLWLSGS